MNLIRIRLLTSAATLLLALPSWASDLAKGYTFSAGEKGVDHTKLNHLVDQAVINTTFYTDKSATTTPAAADIFLLYSSTAAGFRKCSLDSLLFSNAGLITTQTEDTAPATNDFVLTYSVANTSLRKATLEELVFQNPGLITLQPRSTNAPLPGGLVLISSSGTYNAYALTNLLQEWWRWMPFSTNSPTNSLLSLHTAPTNTDFLLIWDSVGKTNKATTLLGLFTNLPSVAVNGVTNGDFIPIVSTGTNANNPFGTNNTFSKVSVTNLFRSYVATNSPVFNSSAVTTNTHGLAGKPQVVRVVMLCTNANNGYLIGDEVDVNDFHANGIYNPVTVSADATKIYLAYGQAGNAWILHGSKADGTYGATITKSDWNLKIYAYYFGL